MSQSIEEEAISQPLFDDTTEINGKEETNNPEKSFSGLNHKTHWLFSGKELSQDTCLEVKPLSIKSLEAAFEKFINQYKQLECSATSSADKRVSVEKTMFLMEDKKYLFTSNYAKYQRNMSTECFTRASVPKPEKRTSAFSSMLLLRQQPSRTAKLKGVDYSQFNADDDDFVECTSKSSSKKQDDVLLHPRNKLCQNNPNQQSQEKKDNSQEISFLSSKTVLGNTIVTSVELTDDEDEHEVAVKESQENKNKRQKLQESETKPSSTITSVTKTIQKGISLVTDKFISSNKKEKCDNGNGTNEKHPIEVDETDEPPPALKRKIKGSTVEKKDLLPCPMCYKKFPKHAINDHAYLCQGPTSPMATRSESSTRKQKEKDGMYGFDVSAWEQASMGITKTRSTNQNSLVKYRTNQNSPVKCRTNQNSPMKNPKLDMRRSHCDGKKPGRDNSPDKQGQATAKHLEEQKKIKVADSAITINSAYTTSTNLLPNKRKRNVFRDEEGRDDEILGGYLSSHLNKQRFIDTKNNFVPPSSSSYFNNSMDNGLFKCVKCEKEFPEDVYKAHTLECLDDTNITFSQ